MEVSGDSMEPGIRGGDSVLIDQSVLEASQASIMAVGHAEHIYIKRLVRHQDGAVTLLSDNPAHAPIHLAGDELDSFRIIGRLVWLYRRL
jgi:phage repressor protein C with HTH and peptisase S24 domain